MAANSMYWVHKKAESGDLDGLKPMSRFVLFALAGYADSHKEAWPTLDQLATLTGISERTISALVDDLVTRGFVSLRRGAHPKRKKNKRHTNIYTLVFIPDMIAGLDQEKAQQEMLIEPRGDLSGFELPAWLKKEHLAVVPDWFPIDVWVRWETSRKENKKPITPTARKQMVKKLEKMREEHEPYGVEYAVAVVERSIENGWRGLFDLSGDALARFNRENYSERAIEVVDAANGIKITEFVRTHPDGKTSRHREERDMSYEELVDDFVRRKGYNQEFAEEWAREIVNRKKSTSTSEIEAHQMPKRNETGRREFIPSEPDNPLAAFEEAVSADISPVGVDFDTLEAEVGGGAWK